MRNHVIIITTSVFSIRNTIFPRASHAGISSAGQKKETATNL